MENKKKQKVSDPIPVDLVIDIFSRVPSKSIARFRCVSKFWGSILRRPDFTDLFLTKSCTRPRLLFTFQLNEELFIYSSPQYLDGINSSVLATRCNFGHKYVPVLERCTPLCGLVLRQGNRKIKERVICNPTTGESITLPTVKGKFGRAYFGYDPVNKQFKVLCITSPFLKRRFTHRVLTLKTGEPPLWREIKCQSDYSHLPNKTSICINGVLYYPAEIKGSPVIVCFDVRFEKFGLVNIDGNMLLGSKFSLVNYNGKLGVHKYEKWTNIHLYMTQFVLWVLEDAGSQKWSKRIYALKVFHGMKSVGMNCRGEIVFTPYYLLNSFDVIYYNLERNTCRRVNIQGFEEFQHHRIPFHTFVDHVENVELLK